VSVTEAAVIPAAAHLELVAIEVARLAAAFVLDHADRATALRTKSTPTDVVTETDLASESLIRRELQARCPGSTIVGEEYDDMVGSNEVGWIVDPIDGTVNFLYGLPVVSVSIAASLGGQIVAGAVADTRSGQVYSARLDGGARLGDNELSVSNPTGLSTALIGTGFAYDAEIRREQAHVLTQLLPTCRDIRCMGSAALNLCFVAAGLLDGYFERDIKLYDYAAGALIAAEAGAVVHARDDETDLTWAATPPIASGFAELIGA
jgi:myo-inositol-1(or 4)-monophosphatase